MSAIKPTYEELAQRVKSLESKLKDCLNVEDVPKESDEGYRSIVEVAPGAIMAIRNGYFLFVNPAGARMLGFSDPEEMVGMPVLDVVAPESQEVVAERIKRLESGKDNLPIKIALISQDGMRVPVESTSTSTPIGGISTAVIFARDISDRKQREKNATIIREKATIR